MPIASTLLSYGLKEGYEFSEKVYILQKFKTAWNISTSQYNRTLPVIVCRSMELRSQTPTSWWYKTVLTDVWNIERHTKKEWPHQLFIVSFSAFLVHAVKQIGGNNSTTHFYFQSYCHFGSTANIKPFLKAFILQLVFSSFKCFV